jgi:hypothetical protein
MELFRVSRGAPKSAMYPPSVGTRLVAGTPTLTRISITCPQQGPTQTYHKVRASRFESQRASPTESPSACGEEVKYVRVCTAGGGSGARAGRAVPKRCGARRPRAGLLTEHVRMGVMKRDKTRTWNENFTGVGHFHTAGLLFVMPAPYVICAKPASGRPITLMRTRVSTTARPRDDQAERRASCSGKTMARHDSTQRTE